MPLRLGPAGYPFTRYSEPLLTTAVPQASTLAPESITDSTFTAFLSILSDGGATVTRAGVAWKRWNPNSGSNTRPGNADTIVDVDGPSGSPYSVNTHYYVTSIGPLYVNDYIAYRAFADTSFGRDYGATCYIVRMAGTPIVETGIPVVTGATTATCLVTTVSTGSASYMSFVASGSFPQGDGPLTRGVCIKANGVPTTADTTISSGLSTGNWNYTASISGLTEGTLYGVRAFGTNGAGTTYGDTYWLLAGSGASPHPTPRRAVLGRARGAAFIRGKRFGGR